MSQSTRDLLHEEILEPYSYLVPTPTYSNLEEQCAKTLREQFKGCERALRVKT